MLLNRRFADRIKFAPVVLLLSLASAAAVAQAGAAGPHTPRSNHRGTIDVRVRTLGKRLALTTAQQVSVKEILTRRQTVIERLRLDTSLSAIDRVHLYRAVDQRAIDQIKALLSAEQLKKYDAPAQPRTLLNSAQQSAGAPPVPPESPP